MGKGIRWVVGLGVVFLIVQSCGPEDVTTGRIITPGADPEWDYDDGRALWDGAEPERVDAWEWRGGVADRRGEYGRRYTVRCVPEDIDLAVWGLGPYTDDSPVCVAAVHSGAIDGTAGGEVTLEIRPAQRRFGGMTRNGVTGLSWGPYPGSFVIVE